MGLNETDGGSCATHHFFAFLFLGALEPRRQVALSG